MWSVCFCTVSIRFNPFPREIRSNTVEYSERNDISHARARRSLIFDFCASFVGGSGADWFYHRVEDKEEETRKGKGKESVQLREQLKWNRSQGRWKKGIYWEKRRERNIQALNITYSLWRPIEKTNFFITPNLIEESRNWSQWELECYRFNSNWILSQSACIHQSIWDIKSTQMGEITKNFHFWMDPLNDSHMHTHTCAYYMIS